MSKNMIISLIGCVILTLAVFIGSTGLGYTIYRPLRFYDVFSLVAAWVGLFGYMWYHSKNGSGKK